MTATQTQIRRGTDGEVTADVPALGEIWYNTTKKRLHVGDGATYGGARIPNAQDIQAGTYDYAAAGGTANAITASTDTNPASMVSGLSIRVKIASANTGAATLQWGSLSATSIKKYASGSKTALSAGDLVAGKIYTFDYDGTDWVVSGGIESGGDRLGDIKIFTSSGTWTKPSGLTKIHVAIIGGGGEGENSGGTTGATGGTTSFGSHCSATGGQGGQSGTRTPGVGSGGNLNLSGECGDTAFQYGGAAPTIGIAASCRTYGTTGQDGIAPGSGGAGNNNVGGCGGGGSFKVITAASLGSSETVTIGAGGDGGLNGGAGAAGYCVVWEFF